jgi:hypothetical protein
MTHYKNLRTIQWVAKPSLPFGSTSCPWGFFPQHIGISIACQYMAPYGFCFCSGGNIGLSFFTFKFTFIKCNGPINWRWGLLVDMAIPSWLNNPGLRQDSQSRMACKLI